MAGKLTLDADREASSPGLTLTVSGAAQTLHFPVLLSLGLSWLMNLPELLLPGVRPCLLGLLVC